MEMPSCLRPNTGQEFVEHGRCCLVRANQLFLENLASHRLGHGISDMEHLDRDISFFRQHEGAQHNKAARAHLARTAEGSGLSPLATSVAVPVMSEAPKSMGTLKPLPL